jgi:hypothetical protein
MSEESLKIRLRKIVATLEQMYGGGDTLENDSGETD